jgi:hypothetical protein
MKTKNFADVIRRQLEADQELVKAVAEEERKANIAQQFYDIRMRGNLSQRQSAKLIGVKVSVVRKVEDADYDGDAATEILNMLIRARQ